MSERLKDYYSDIKSSIQPNLTNMVVHFVFKLIESWLPVIQMYHSVLQTEKTEALLKSFLDVDKSKQIDSVCVVF